MTTERTITCHTQKALPQDHDNLTPLSIEVGDEVLYVDGSGEYYPCTVDAIDGHLITVSSDDILAEALRSELWKKV